MVDIAKLQKKRNTLFLAPKRKLTSVIKPTTVDTTPVASAPYVPSSSINTSAGSGTSVIAPTTTTTSTTSAPPTAPAAPKTNPITDTLKNAAVVGGTALAAKAIIDYYNKPAAPATNTTTAPVTKPTTSPAAPAAPVVKPLTSVVIPPALQKEQDARVAAANTAKAAADHNALAGSFDQGTKVGLPTNTIPNNTPARASTIDESMFDDPLDQGQKLGLEENVIPNNTPAEAGTIDESMFDFEDEYVQDDLGNIYKMIDDKPVLIRSAEVDEDISEEDYDLFGYSPEETDTGTELGLDYNTIPNNTPAEASTIDESMFDDPTGSAEPSPVLVQDENGNLFLANADGSYTPADAEGNAVGEPTYIGGNEEGGGTEYADNNYGDTALDTGGDVGGYEAYDDAGNLWFVGDDGSFNLIESASEEPAYEQPAYEDSNAGGYEARDADGNLWHVNEDGSYDLVESAYEEPAYEEPAYEDSNAGGYEAYDDAGNLFFVGDDGSFTLLESANEEPDYGYDFDHDLGYYEEPPPYIEPDLSYLDDFTYEEPDYGYDFDYDPGYYEEPFYNDYESDLSYLDDYKRGGQVQQMKKGGLPHFYTGGGAYDSLDEDYVDDYQTNSNSSGYYNSDDYDVNNSDSNYYNSNDYAVNNDNSEYYTSVNNDNSSYYDSYDLKDDEVLMEDEDGRKFAIDSNGDYRLVQDSKFPTNADPTKPTYRAETGVVNNDTSNYTGVPKTSSGSGGSGFNYKDLFSTDNIKALAGAGLGAAGLMTLYNSFKGNESTYKPAAYTPPAIPKRTTDFGMGPAKTVTPTMGGLQTMTPSQQEELYTNLGVAGYEMEHEDPVEDTVEDQPMADGGFAQPQTSQSNSSYFTYGVPQDPLEVLGVKQPQEKSQNGGLQMRRGGLPHLTADVPIVQGRKDYRQGAAVNGKGDGQSDDIPAMLADGEYVIDSDVVAALGNGSNKAGAEVLDKFREAIRTHKRSAPIGKIPPKAKSPLAYLKEAT